MFLVEWGYGVHLEFEDYFSVFGCWKLAVHISSIGIRGVLQFTPYC